MDDSSKFTSEIFLPISQRRSSYMKCQDKQLPKEPNQKFNLKSTNRNKNSSLKSNYIFSGFKTFLNNKSDQSNKIMDNMDFRKIQPETAVQNYTLPKNIVQETQEAPSLKIKAPHTQLTKETQYTKATDSKEFDPQNSERPANITSLDQNRTNLPKFITKNVFTISLDKNPSNSLDLINFITQKVYDEYKETKRFPYDFYKIVVDANNENFSYYEQFDYFIFKQKFDDAMFKEKTTPSLANFQMEKLKRILEKPLHFNLEKGYFDEDKNQIIFYYSAKVNH